MPVDRVHLNPLTVPHLKTDLMPSEANALEESCHQTSQTIFHLNGPLRNGMAMTEIALRYLVTEIDGQYFDV